MPTYQYACTECGEPLEVVQSFSDDPLTTCPACGGRLRKVFNSVGIVFKGSGFYRTDSRKGADSKASNRTGSDAAAATTKPDGASSTTSSSGSATGTESSGSSSTAGATSSSSPSGAGAPKAASA